MKKNYFKSLFFTMIAGVLSSLSFGQTTLNYTGAPQTFTVPAGVNLISIECWGASGWTGTNPGGQGGYTYGELSVTPGQDIYIYVGGVGTVANGNYVPAGAGWNGGGNGQSNGATNAVGGGGGASDARLTYNVNPMDPTSLNSRVIVAGGGGGSTNNTGAYGGNGGGLIGQDGGQHLSYPFGTGGSQVAGGSFGGTFGQGGNADGTMTPWNGAGGGGWYGGGISTEHSGGGGGSSYIDGVTNGSVIQGSNIGNGYVTITPLCLGLVTSVSATELCEGELVTLSATSSGSGIITWDNGVVDNVPFAPPVGTTTYTATSSDLGECGFNVDITVSEIPTVNAGVDITLCTGVADTAVTATGTADLYTWNNGVSNGVTFTPNIGTTTYIVVGENIPSGCQSSDSLVIQVGSPAISLSAFDEMAGNDGSVVLTINSGNAPFTFDWNNGATTNDLSGLAAGTYVVTMTDASGCSVTDSITVGSQLGINSMVFSSLSVYPSPTENVINLELNGEFQYQMIDAVGNAVKNGQGVDSKKINLADLSNGVYFVRISTEGNSTTIRIVKQ